MVHFIFNIIGYMSGAGLLLFFFLFMLAADGKQSEKVVSVRYINCTEEDWENYERAQAMKQA